MSSQKETPVLIASLLITVGLLGGGYWWLTRSGNFSLGPLTGTGTSTPAPTAPSPDSGAAPTPTAPSPGSGAAQFSDVSNVPSGLFNYGGSTTWAPIRGAIDPLIQQAQPDFQLRYTDPIGTPPGSGPGIQMLLNNQLSFAQSSRSVSPQERQQAEQRGYALREIPIALEGLAIAVNNDMPIEGITLDQLRNIYLGNLTNWNQVGGPNLPIVPISRPSAGGTVEFFVSTVLGGANLTGTVQTADTTTQALRLVDATPGAIYYASAPEVVGQCTVKPIAIGRQLDQLVKPYADPYVPPENCPNQRNQINSAALLSGDYPLTRRLFVIVKEDGQLDQQAGEAYADLLLTQQGQALLQETGFVAIR
ncbi:PstS family phosphate ABC transporter substrate-binding protein [Oscillatoria sp. CS-180]|uniref:PstS family phosphate ABC transporter substrate-binding protein n=1 Tax=Oscillatoria sp. CS-180 TaxID=3021720 RepID=UPI00232F53BD|nr:PstS family phosphate ABC transporter substrate-binding protein [Oscillatoria sp. CS-180]MDB9528298.1 PstS family phosphate ABC transporter substrate-binding protein [Oscillatoria sp. CS-180]